MAWYTRAMTPSRWIAVGAFWMAVAVTLGAFGAHALEDRLLASGHLDSWRTGVRYHAWHALALIAMGLLQERGLAGRVPAWCFLIGSVLFSGSIYGLSLGGSSALGPITPLGGLLLIVGWVALGISSFRR